MKPTAILLFFSLCLFSAEQQMLFEHDTIVSSNIFIPENTTCTITPGVQIQFDGYYKFAVKGLLIARGTAEKPIVITCVNRPRGEKGNPCWNGLMICGEKSQALFAHCRIEGAYKNVVWQSKPIFDSCEIAGNHYGLYCIKSSPHIKACTVRRNVYGITSDYATPLLLDNTITDNTFGIFLQLDTKLIAGKNTITGNETNVRTEQCLGKTNADMTLQCIWDMMRELY
jgi:parallel beta-helix repeat protein